MSEDRWVEGLAGTDLSSLEGLAVAFRPYRQYTDGWDHDHCESCMAGPNESDPTDLHEGWTTTSEYDYGAEYLWLCDSCYQRFKHRLGLREVDDPRPVRQKGLGRVAQEHLTTKPPRINQ